MIFFNYKPKPKSYTPIKGIPDFKNSKCRCLQQEMDLSELTWIDTSSYKKLKQILKCQNTETRRMNLLSKPQMDLFV